MIINAVEMILRYLKSKIRKINWAIRRLIFMKKDSTVKIGSGSNISKDSTLEGFNRIGINCKFDGQLGKYSFIGGDSNIKGKVGRFCSIGFNIDVIEGTHPVSDFISSHPIFYSTAKQSGITFVNENRFKEKNYSDETNKYVTEIGNDVWIGNNVLILGGIKIGNGAIIAAGAVVTKDVPDYSVVGGVPAILIKKRFDRDIIEKLQKVKWWDKNEEWLEENAIYFNDINKVKSW